jgi:dTDP-4-dehydrorhamnose 3,5-epimerase
MEVTPLAIADVKLVRPTRHADQRGYFSEVYNKRALAAVGIDHNFVQDNQSLSRAAGTVRGLHFQTAPFEQVKLVRVLRGSIFDVAVDLRRSSATFGKWVGLELDADSWGQVLIPAGFAHGFCTLQPNTEIAYKVTNFYAPAHDFGLMWNDPDLAIVWPPLADAATLSEKDRRYPPLKDLAEVFP